MKDISFAMDAINDAIAMFEAGNFTEKDLKMMCLRLMGVTSYLSGFIEGVFLADMRGEQDE